MSRGLRRAVCVLAASTTGLLGCGTEGAGNDQPVGTATGAVVSGTVDSANTFSNVGALVVEFNGAKRAICTGTLIARKVFLTASHCVSFLPSLGITTVYASFDPKFDPATSKLYSGTAHVHPSFGRRGNNDPHDIAVVTLDKAPSGLKPATLPQLDEFKVAAKKNGLKNQTFTAVGYGVFDVTVGKGQPTFAFDATRRYATSRFHSIENAWLHLSQNASTGDGGTCYGDSGGPNFFGTSSVVAGLTVTGDIMCRATNVIYRTDTASARAFLDDFVDLP